MDGKHDRKEVEKAVAGGWSEEQNTKHNGQTHSLYLGLPSEQRHGIFELHNVTVRDSGTDTQALVVPTGTVPAPLQLLLHDSSPPLETQ